MVINDIPGATKRDKYGHIATRDNNKCDDIPGASTKVYHKIYYDKEGYMGPRDPPKKKFSEMRTVISNPLSPKYKVAGANAGESIEIGEIEGQRPKENYKRGKISDRDNL